MIFRIARGLAGLAVRMASRWTLLAPTVAVGLVVLGLALIGATAIYDLTSADVADYVTPAEAANRNGLADLGRDVVDQLTTAVTGLAAAGLLLSMTGLMRGKTWAHATTCIVTAPFALCGGLAFINSQGPPAGNPGELGNLTLGHTSAPTWVLVGDTLGPALLVGGAVIALILLQLPAVYRRFHPSR
ncbi:hypothetical protein [Micromonospora sp. NPDC023888]|uniref:hypothetical protein n=1 Tax=Micromonospora sp. NPDC023888 TaxID=3155607 RepID=UPI0034067AF7